jgi:hypothetical protein
MIEPAINAIVVVFAKIGADLPDRFGDEEVKEGVVGG